MLSHLSQLGQFDQLSHFTSFLVADTQLCEKLCPSLGPSVGPSVDPSVRPSVRPSIRPSSQKVECFRYFLCMFVCMMVGEWRVDGGWTLLPTRPQQYCDPASLVFLFKSLEVILSHLKSIEVILCYSCPARDL